MFKVNPATLEIWDEVPLWRAGLRRRVSDGWPRALRPRLAAFDTYIRSLIRPGADVAQRAHVDLQALPGLLSSIMLLECVPQASLSDGGAIGPSDYAFLIRAVGTDLCRSFGHDPTGRYMHSFYQSENLVLVQRVYRAVMAERRPHYWRGLDPFRPHLVVPYERTLYPLADARGTVTHLIGCWNFDVPMEPPFD